MRARLLFAAVFLLLCLPVLLLPAGTVRLESQAVQSALTDWRKAQAELADAERAGGLLLAWPGGSTEAEVAIQSDVLRAALQVAQDQEIVFDGERFRVPLGGAAPAALAEVQRADGWLRVVPPQDGAGPEATVRLGSRLALAPPLLAILLAFLTRAILPSLGLGVFVGVFLMLQPGQGVGTWFQILFGDILWGTILTDSFHLYILGFVLVLSSTVSVVARMGGIEGMVRSLLRFAKSSRSVQTVAYAMGLGIFFDDYANTIIVGNSCGPLFDKMKISRAKLAYIVDSTAAPVAGVALLSTWVAYQISTYAPQLPTVGMESSEGYAIFLRTIPYRFYCLLALAMVAMVVFSGRDFGPMRKVEEHARRGGGGADDSAMPMEQVQAAPGATPRWFNGVFPIGLMIFGTFALILWSGAVALQGAAAEGDAAAAETLAAGGFTWLTGVLAEADSTWAIFWGSVSSLVLAALLALGQRLLPPAEVGRTATAGLSVLFKDAVMVLILAWSIGAVCQGIGTAAYLVAVFEDLLSPAFLPVILFLASCFVAFATGSSWTTMAILQPNVVLLAWELGKDSPMGSEMLLVMSIGAVLEGAIFGDHCSPISDTTVLSSTASRCLHIDHVRTQAPYALVTAAAAICCAYLPVGLYGMSPWVGLGLGLLALALFLRFVGRRPAEGTAAVPKQT